MANSQDSEKFFSKYRQQILYFTFAAIMVCLNYLIQWLNQEFFSVWVENVLGHLIFVQKWYLATEPYNMTELVGSVVAVGVTYIAKFVLDKFVVFEKKDVDVKDTSKEFSLYFLFAIFTTIENIGIQFLLTNFLNTPMILSLVIALTCGYITKFFLDRKFVFQKEKEN